MSMRQDEEELDTVTMETVLQNGDTETDASDHSGDDDGDEALFVPEDEYAPLEEDDEDIGSDIFNPNRIPQDLERMLDERLEAELDLKSTYATENLAPEASATAFPTVGDSIEQKSDPLKVNVTTPMSAEHINQIRNVMAGIQLSDDAIPEWAKRVPESAWIPRREEHKPSLPENAQT